MSESAIHHENGISNLASLMEAILELTTRFFIFLTVYSYFYFFSSYSPYQFHRDPQI
jgi:hypothetical protein